VASPDLPVGVSVTPIWDSSSTEADDSSSKPAATNQQVVLDKLLLTVEAVSSAATNKPTGTKKAEPNISDFQPRQKVTVHVSTVLNSPSVLDRIEYVSTYIYIYPWQDMPNGNVVLERELWRDFFAVNTVRDSLIRNSQVTNDIRRAIEDMRVHVTDIGTLVQFNPVDLGSLQQTTTDTTDLGFPLLPRPRFHP